MTNEEAIKTLEANYPDACFGQLREAVDAAIEALKAQDADSDTISRKAAIDAILAVTGNASVRELYEHVQEHGLSDMWSGGVNAALDIIIAVPPVDSTQTQRRANADSTQNCALDCVSRQAAIDALIRKIRPHNNGDGTITMWVMSEELVRETLNEVPSAQPDLQSTCNKLATDTISRAAAIEAHYEYCNKHPDAGFPVWSLKILEDLPSAQPEKRTEERAETHACEYRIAEALAYIRGKTDDAAQYEQMAEECIELAHACLKKARILRGASPTPADIHRVDANIREELTDLRVCADVAGEKYDAGLYEKKVLRWRERLS